MAQTKIPAAAKGTAENNPFDIVRRQVDKCAEILKLEPTVTEMLKKINPGLRFERSYAAIRPYAPYCEETILLEE